MSPQDEERELCTTLFATGAYHSKDRAMQDAKAKLARQQEARNKANREKLKPTDIKVSPE